MNQTAMIDCIRNEAKTNKAVEAFFHVCALRKRARQNLTVTGVMQRMKKEGFDNFSRKDAEHIIALMGHCGLGVIKTTKSGHPEAVTGLKISLQSIGMAALGQANNVRAFRKRNRFAPLAVPAAPKAAEAPRQQLPAAGATAQERPGSPVFLTVLVNGKPVNFGIPNELDDRDVADLVSRFRHEQKAV